MSRFKFRVWRGSEFKIIDDLYWFEENFIHDFDEAGYTFQQFTGLQDASEVDIYEGDILMAEGDTYQVVFDEGLFGVENGGMITPLYQYKDGIVIGNIFED